MIKEIILSFIAGTAVFISPCVLPLIPAYIFYITGLRVEEKIDDKFKFIIRIIFFILGFTIIFTALGIITALLTFRAGNIRKIINIVFGIILIIFSFHFMGLINIFFLNYEKRFNFTKLPTGNIGTLLVGMAFAAGWTPCVGPLLGSILALVSTGDSLIKGIILLLIFSMGLAIPLIITAMFFNYVNPMLTFLKKHTEIIKKISGAFLFLIGILLLFNAINSLPTLLFKFGFFLENSKPISNYIFSVILLSFSIILILLMIFKRKKSISLVILAIIFFILALLNFFNFLPLLDFLIKYITSYN
jgi:cytochrome c-type biogenesis protein